MRAPVPEHLQGKVGSAPLGHPVAARLDESDAAEGGASESDSPRARLIGIDQHVSLLAAPSDSLGIVSSRSGRRPGRQSPRLAVTDIRPDGIAPNHPEGSEAGSRAAAPRMPGSTLLKRAASMSPRLTGAAGQAALVGRAAAGGKGALVRSTSHREMVALQGAMPPLLDAMNLNRAAPRPRHAPILRLQPSEAVSNRHRQDSGGSTYSSVGPVSRRLDSGGEIPGTSAKPSRVAVIDIHAMIGAIDALIEEQTAMTQYKKEKAAELVERRKLELEALDRRRAEEDEVRQKIAA